MIDVVGSPKELTADELLAWNEEFWAGTTQWNNVHLHRLFVTIDAMKAQRERVRAAVMAVLLEFGELKGDKQLEHTTPTHGNCCTCQECGHFHDDCVCYHNELLGKLTQAFEAE